MNYNYLRSQFYKQRKKKSLSLLRMTRVNFYLLSALNSLDGFIIKTIAVVLGFQYDIYMKLYETTYDSFYLSSAEMIKFQIEVTLESLGE